VRLWALIQPGITEWQWSKIRCRVPHPLERGIERLLRERISLRGLCRVVGVSLTWLLHFIVECFAACPDNLHVQVLPRPIDVVLRQLEAEANEMWSFVKQKGTQQWIWIALDQGWGGFAALEYEQH
jgi:hypothetical protein